MDANELLDRTDAILAQVGQHGFKDIEELQRLACSMFVYLFESIFDRLEGVERRPRLKAEYAYNADLVIHAFENIVGVNLADISGEEIAEVRG
jgi:hypothetical protein